MSYEQENGILEVAIVVVVYILRNFNLYLSTSSIKNNKEERRSGTAGTGDSQKDLQLGNTNNV